MKYAISENIKKHLRKNLEDVCNGYLSELFNFWDLKSTKGYWIGDKIGDIFDYDGLFVIQMNDIIYCVEHNISKEQYLEWSQYICDAGEFNLDIPDLKSWINGCPRANVNALQNLRNLKDQFEKAIEEEKEKLKHDII